MRKSSFGWRVDYHDRKSGKAYRKWMATGDERQYEKADREQTKAARAYAKSKKR